MINKKLSLIIIVLIPFFVVSFILKDKTTFLLEEPIVEEKPITVKILTNGTIEELDLEDYIVGVVAAEMPASFEMEALKAQAVASRSYALYKKNNSNNSNNSYDLTDNTNTQVYINEDKMHEKWGSDYDAYYTKVQNAVLNTKGEVATYNGEIIEAFYFSMSSGLTQDVASVFNETKDYLVSVESIYDNSNIHNYEVETTIPISIFKEKLSLTCQNITINNIIYTPSNYVKTVDICGITFNGNTVRYKLGLRSANFQINISDGIKITTKGYGHGVGMSQYGANGYAKDGYTYQDIIKHYYQNVEITDIKNV